jgi:hypothetical protein
MILACALEIWTDKNLEELAQLVSNHVLGGVQFGGAEEHIRDEVPAVFIKQHVLGLEIVLCGFGGQEGYYLTMESKYRGQLKTAGQIRKQTVDLSPYVANLLSKAADIHVSFKGL